jgi:hypothetical protein
MNYKFKLSRRLSILWTGPEHVIITAFLATCLSVACSPGESTLEPVHTVTQLLITPATTTVLPGVPEQFTSWGVMSDGTTAPVSVAFTATGGTITPDGTYTADSILGDYQVTARMANGLATTSAVKVDSVRPGQPILTAPQWTVQDDGSFVTVEGSVLRVKFAYGGPGSGGWFKGGGGSDGGIVELYYKPTSLMRNLVFRNGVWGGGRDQLDFFQAETLSVAQADYVVPDFLSGIHATINSHRTWESAGRLFAEFDFQFRAWRIVRTYILYPWGDLTVHARVTLTQPGRWNYLGHTFQFGVSPYTVVNGQSYNWGGNYQSDGDSFHAWSDGYGVNGTSQGTGYYEYRQTITRSFNRNSSIADFGRTDQYSGFMIDDRNGNDPDIVVMNGDSTTWHSPFDLVARKVGGRSYVETGIFTPAYTNPLRTFAGTNWFYATLPPCCPSIYNSPMYWPASLGTWEEVFHVLLRRTVQPSDYLPLWQVRARKLGQQVPQPVVGFPQAQLNSLDRVYHLTADAGAPSVQFQWTRASSGTTPIDYRTAFVVENFDPSGVRVAGGGGATAQAYFSATDRTTLVVLSGPDAPTAGTYTVTLTRP